MNINFNAENIEEVIRQYSKKKLVPLDIANTLSWMTEKDKLFYAKESKNKIEISRIKTPFTALLPNIIIAFKKDDFQHPKFRLSIWGYLLMLLLTALFLFTIIKTLTDKNFEGDIIFALFLLLSFLILCSIEYAFTKRVIQKLLKELEKKV